MQPYLPRMKRFARALRNDSTKSEIKLWQYLQKRQVNGQKFNRQKPIGNYIVDFYCAKAKIAIELDGYSHNLKQVVEKDAVKQQYLESLDIKVLHFSDSEVMDDIENVLREISAATILL